MRDVYFYKGRALFSHDGEDIPEAHKREFRHAVDAKEEKNKSKVKTMDMQTAVWQTANNGTKFASVGKTTRELPAGEYIFEEDSNGRTWASKQKSITDNLIDLPGLPTQFILDQINMFWSKGEEYAKYGWLQKRGILLYGDPGCGKTSIIALLKRQLIGLNGLIFGMGEGGYSQLTGGLKEVRDTEPERPVMTVVEDIETYLEGSNGSNVARQEKDALALYDGENQINNVVHIATTNKPDVVADRFMKRPGRFDLVIGLHSPTEAARRVYLESICKGNISEAQIDEIVTASKGLSLAYMREIASTYLVLGIPLQETIARLRKNSKQNFTKTNKEGFEVGFGLNKE
ncbi:Proteasome-activating nucleotidase 1 [uncultured archaeon]|nr:Proteasome-activating nucleotidase 1 [uncultured archaeon]